MSLSLVVRKNIRDYTPKMTANLETIREVTGVDFQVEIDFAGVKAAIPATNSYCDRLGEVFYDWYLKSLASRIKGFAQDPLQREAFVEAFSERKTIRFVMVAKIPDGAYGKTSNDGGVLVAHIPIDNFCSNVDNLGGDLSKTCSGGGPLSLVQRKNIADYNHKLQSNLADIKESTGIDFDVEIDWADIVKQMGSTNSYVDRVGESFYDWYLTALARNLKRLCADELGKEAFAERCGPKKTIQFRVIDKAPKQFEGKYVWTEIPSDGTLLLTIPKNNVCSNVDNCGTDIEKLL